MDRTKLCKKAKRDTTYWRLAFLVAVLMRSRHDRETRRCDLCHGGRVVICVTVAALALAAAGLGIIGEATKSRSFVRYDGVNCLYRRTPAFDCGIAAAASLLTGQVILTAATGCWDGCRRRSSDHRGAGAVFASVLSWFLAILSASAFLVGALKNESGERRPKEDIASYYQCTVLVAVVFAGASFFSLVAAAVGITSYIASEQAVSIVLPPSPPRLENPGKGAVVIGQPQLELHQASPAYGSAKFRTVKELFEDECGGNYVLCD